MCVMCSTSVPTLFQYFFYDHIPTFLYIFHEMFFITCLYLYVTVHRMAKRARYMTAEEVLLDFEDEPMMSGSEDHFSDLGENTEDFESDDEDTSPPLSLSLQPRVPSPSLQPQVPSPSLQPRVPPPSLQPRAPTPPPSPTLMETLLSIQVCVHMYNLCTYHKTASHIHVLYNNCIHK